MELLHGFKTKFMDVKDFMSLALLYDGYTFTQIEPFVEITRSAITQRTYRYKKIWPDWAITDKVCIGDAWEYKYTLSDKAMEVGKLAKEILKIVSMM